MLAFRLSRRCALPLLGHLLTLLHLGVLPMRHLHLLSRRHGLHVARAVVCCGVTWSEARARGACGVKLGAGDTSHTSNRRHVLCIRMACPWRRMTRPRLKLRLPRPVARRVPRVRARCLLARAVPKHFMLWRFRRAARLAIGIEACFLWATRRSRHPLLWPALHVLFWPVLHVLLRPVLHVLTVLLGPVLHVLHVLHLL
jgi:hypothetical protein